MKKSSKGVKILNMAIIKNIHNLPLFWGSSFFRFDFLRCNFIEWDINWHTNTAATWSNKHIKAIHSWQVPILHLLTKIATKKKAIEKLPPLSLKLNSSIPKGEKRIVPYAAVPTHSSSPAEILSENNYRKIHQTRIHFSISQVTRKGKKKKKHPIKWRINWIAYFSDGWGGLW